jgi:hypothetical protein
MLLAFSLMQHGGKPTIISTDTASQIRLEVLTWVMLFILLTKSNHVKTKKEAFQGVLTCSGSD